MVGSLLCLSRNTEVRQLVQCASGASSPPM
jgi:hypothetical protein